MLTAEALFYNNIKVTVMLVKTGLLLNVCTDPHRETCLENWQREAV